MADKHRRNLLKSGGTALAVGMLAGVTVGARAAGHSAAPPMSEAAVLISADTEGICATCRYWGGMRRVSKDKNYVHCVSLGWCNNTASPRYQTMTTPEMGPMKTWRKWEAL